MDMSGKTLHDLNITSPQTKEYNCIAWAAGENDRYWWPDPMESGYWPPGLRRSESIENFIEAFKTIGYECCDNENAEESYDKIAVFPKMEKLQPMHLGNLKVVNGQVSWGKVLM